MLPTDGDDLLICRMIAGFQMKCEFRPRRLQIMHESCLLDPGSKDQDIVAGLDSFGDRREKRRILLDMARSDRIRMMVQMG